MVQSPSEKLNGLQLVKKFPAFHGTRRFITALTNVRLLGQPNPVHIPTSHLLEIYPICLKIPEIAGKVHDVKYVL